MAGAFAGTTALTLAATGCVPRAGDSVDAVAVTGTVTGAGLAGVAVAVEVAVSGADATALVPDDADDEAVTDGVLSLDICTCACCCNVICCCCF